MFPEAKSVELWLRHAWHVAVAYVIGFFVLFAVLGWHPNEPHKVKKTDSPKSNAAVIWNNPHPLPVSKS